MGDDNNATESSGDRDSVIKPKCYFGNTTATVAKRSSATTIAHTANTAQG